MEIQIRTLPLLRASNKAAACMLSSIMILKMTSATKLLALVVVLLQTVPAVPIRIGDFAGRLTTQDVMDLGELATAGGAKGSPWLLEGPFGQIGNSIRMYLPADTQTVQLRRGQAIEALRRPPDNGWSVRRTVQYAQVIETGQNFNSLNGDLDNHRPFPVSGTFSDEELVSLVTFIRSSPDGVEGSWPITSLSVDAGSVTLMLAGPGPLQRVSVVRRGTTWAVTEARKGRA